MLSVLMHPILCAMGNWGNINRCQEPLRLESGQELDITSYGVLRARRVLVNAPECEP